MTEVSSDGSAFVYSSYLGGSGADFTMSQSGSHGGIAVDASGNAYVGGETQSTDFPTADALQATSGGSTDGTVTKIGELPTPVPGTTMPGLSILAGLLLAASLWARFRSRRSLA